MWLYDPCTGEDVPWRFTDDDTDGVLVDIPLYTSMNIGERIVLVKSASAVNGEFPGQIPSGTQVFEWGDGKLANSDDKITLWSPGEWDTADRKRYYIRVDRVVYSDGSHPVGDDPWPTAPDGEGSSLEKKTPLSLYGNDVINWQADTASPGDP